MSKYIENYELLTEDVKNQSKALQSLIEELEAVDFYNQRACICTDPELKEILIHNRDEETEHSFMLLEWLRRNMPTFDKEAKEYMFSTGSITAKEKGATETTEEKKEEDTNSYIGNLFVK